MERWGGREHAVCVLGGGGSFGMAQAEPQQQQLGGGGGGSVRGNVFFLGLLPVLLS